MKPLTGRTIVVTRPREQAGPLCEGIAAAGGTPIAFPLLEIAALPDDPAFELAMAALDQAALAVFISPNAVTFGLAQSGSAQSGLAQAGLTPVRRQRDWPSNLPVAAVGQGTARTLREHGFAQVIVPDDGFDSEALLACPELAAERLGGKTVLLFKGEGGRDLLASTLSDRGATVLPAPCYRRLPPQEAPPLLFLCWRLPPCRMIRRLNWRWPRWIRRRWLFLSVPTRSHLGWLNQGRLNRD